MSFSSPRRHVEDYGWRPPTTYVDVLFLIMTFFITTAVFHDEDDRRININLPAAESPKPAAPASRQIVITVTSKGDYLIGDRPYTTDTLKTTLAGLAKDFPNEPVLIRGDRNSALGDTVRVMDIARSVGLNNVFLATIKPASEAGK